MPRPADRWCDVDGAHISLFCRVEQVAESTEGASLLPSRLHHQGEVVGRGVDQLYVRFSDDTVVSLSPDLLRLLPDVSGGADAERHHAAGQIGAEHRPVMLLRYRWGVVGETARTVHVVPLLTDGQGSVVGALCGAVLQLADIETVAPGEGMPCTVCVIHRATDTAVAQRPPGNGSEGADTVGIWTDADMCHWIALRRVLDGGVRQLDGHYWVDHGRTPPDYIIDALTQLFDAGLVTLADPDPGAAAMWAVLTHTGAARYRQLTHTGLEMSGDLFIDLLRDRCTPGPTGEPDRIRSGAPLRDRDRESEVFSALRTAQRDPPG